MKPLSKGDPVKVRLHTGEVVEAVYDRNGVSKMHWVCIYGEPHLACGSKPEAADECCHASVRFVANPCVLLPVGVSV